MYILNLCALVLVCCIVELLMPASACQFLCRDRSCNVRHNCEGVYVWTRAQERAMIGGKLFGDMQVILPEVVSSVKLADGQRADEKLCRHFIFELDALTIFARPQWKVICNESAVPLSLTTSEAEAHPLATAASATPLTTVEETTEPTKNASRNQTVWVAEGDSGGYFLTTTTKRTMTTLPADAEMTTLPPDTNSTTITTKCTMTTLPADAEMTTLPPDTNSTTIAHTTTIAPNADQLQESDTDDILVISISVPTSLIVLIVIAVRIYFKRQANVNDPENDIELRHIELSPASAEPSPAVPAPPTPPPVHQPAQPKAKHAPKQEPPSTPPAQTRRSRRTRHKPDRWSPNL